MTPHAERGGPGAASRCARAGFLTTRSSTQTTRSPCRAISTTDHQQSRSAATFYRVVVAEGLFGSRCAVEPLNLAVALRLGLPGLGGG